MDYRKVMTKATENRQHASTAGPVKRYSTEVSASKKPPPRPSGVQSEAVKAFLAKRKEEDENKARLAEKKKQELLELRSIARHGRKANAMAKRTKDNNFMTNFAKTAELAAEQPYTSNVGSVQRRFTQKPLSPQWRQSPSMSSSVVERPSASTNHPQHRSSRPDSQQQQQPKLAAANSALNFYDLLKVAAKKQHEPVDLPRIPKKPVSQMTVQEQGRMMTTDEKRRFQEELARKRGKSLDEVHVPKRTRRKYVAGESEGEQDVDDNERVGRRPAQARDVQPPSRGRPPAGFGLPQAAAKQPIKTPLPPAQQSQFAAKKYLHLNERTRPPSAPTVNGNNLRPTYPKKASPARRSDERVQRMPQKNESQSVRSAQNPIKRTANPSTTMTPRDSRDVKPPAKVVPNKASMLPIGNQRSSSSALKASTPSTSSSVKQKQLASSSNNPVANGKFARPSAAPSSSSRMSSSSSTMPPQKSRRLDDNARLPSSSSSLRPSMSSSTRQQTETQPKVRGRPPSPPRPPPSKQQQLPVKASSSRQPLAGSRPQVSSPPSRGRPQMSSPPSRGRLPPLPSRGSGRPLPSSQSRPFPPRDLEPRMFPPRDLERRPMQRPPLKRRIESDEDDEDDYDEEMDDFIDDGPLEDGNDLDYSEHIREIFGYDRTKYRYEPDDRCMESSFLQQMKEEAISAKMGILEDLEDIQREEEEMKRRTVRSKKPK